MKDSVDLAEKIEKLMLNNNLEKEMGKESRILAEKLSWEVVAKNYINLYEKTANLGKIRQGE
jgi:glycosyltransferase involved in cell wall biosynthesis